MVDANMGFYGTQTWKFDHVWYQTKQTYRYFIIG